MVSQEQQRRGTDGANVCKNTKINHSLDEGEGGRGSSKRGERTGDRRRKGWKRGMKKDKGKKEEREREGKREKR